MPPHCFPHCFPSRLSTHVGIALALLAAPAALAQLNFLNIPDPAPLPSPPTWERLLLESPLHVLLVLATGGVVLVALFNQRGDLRKGLRLGGPLLAAALCVWLLSQLVSTDRENLKAAALDLVRGVASGDVTTTDRALAADAILRTFVDANGLAKDRILERVGRDFKKGGSLEIKEYAILEMQATTQGDRDGFVQFKLRATPTNLGGPTFSWWRLDLSRSPEGQWQTTGIDMLESSFGRR